MIFVGSSWVGCHDGLIWLKSAAGARWHDGGMENPRQAARYSRTI